MPNIAAPKGELPTPRCWSSKFSTKLKKTVEHAFQPEKYAAYPGHDNLEGATSDNW